MPSRPLKVFLCHAHADRDPVRGLYARLTQDGVDAWLDKAKLLPGQDWELEIRKAVREADVVVVCLSKQFNQAGFRQKEVRLALDTAMEKPEGEIFIIPARLEECDTLESLKKWHWVDLFEDEGYEMLMRALRARADKIGASVKIASSKKAPRINPTNPAFPMAIPYYLRKVEEEGKEKLSSNITAPILESEVNHPTASSKIKSPKIRIEILVAIIGAVATIIAGILSSPLIEKWFVSEPMPTSTFSQMSAAQETMTTAAIFLATQTMYPILTSTEVNTPTVAVTPLPTKITDTRGVQMSLVPAGEFTMGSNLGEPDETPVHHVYLDAYYMDVYEVTNWLYKACVDMDMCMPPSEVIFYGDVQYAEHPVAYVDWDMAKTYCEWRGAKLPSEAQWEKAARGTDGRTYPWGEDLDCNRANYYSCVGNTKKVGSYESGISPYGVYDMTGNVWEWVADWYSETYYQVSPSSNPTGLDIGEFRLLRGGSRNYYGLTTRSTYRFKYDPSNSYYTLPFVGFRCARNVNP